MYANITDDKQCRYKTILMKNIVYGKNCWQKIMFPNIVVT